MPASAALWVSGVPGEQPAQVRLQDDENQSERDEEGHDRLECRGWQHQQQHGPGDAAQQEAAPNRTARTRWPASSRR